MGIRPILRIEGHIGSAATITARVEFDDFDKAMEFNELLVGFLARELSAPTVVEHGEELDPNE